MIYKTQHNENRVGFTFRWSPDHYATLILDLKENQKVSLWFNSITRTWAENLGTIGFEMTQDNSDSLFRGKRALEEWTKLVGNEPDGKESIGLAIELLGEL